MSALSITAAQDRVQHLFPGLIVCAILASAAAFISQHYAIPVMLIALLLGMSMNFLSVNSRCTAGIEFTARSVLRVGVALLGMRIAVPQIASLGWQPILIVIVSVSLTIGVSTIAARLLGFQTLFGLLTGGATAICGVSAALALSAALPNHPLKERATLFTIVGVSTLSTLAMIAYPIFTQMAGLDARTSGIFIGATIHDVAQVIGAGYSVSQEAGDVATYVKLMRIAMLLPVVVFAGVFVRQRQAVSGRVSTQLVPWFVIAFAALIAVNSAGIIPAAVVATANDVSRWCFIAAVGALGMKTSVRDLAAVGVKPIVLMVAETIFLAVLVFAML
jgi:uncharacterized integral membrane protein (TIGR00698 family)